VAKLLPRYKTAKMGQKLFRLKAIARQAHTVHHRVEYFGQRSLSWKVTARNSTLQSGRLNGEMLRQYAKETRRQDQRRRRSLELGRHRRGSGARQCPVGPGPGRRFDGPSAPETEASFAKFHYKKTAIFVPALTNSIGLVLCYTTKNLLRYNDEISR